MNGAVNKDSGIDFGFIEGKRFYVHKNEVGKEYELEIIMK